VWRKSEAGGAKAVLPRTFDRQGPCGVPAVRTRMLSR
jgi:hypothetical protein